MKKKILVLSSTFPRWKDDHEPPFVFELSRRYTDEYDVHVLAPHATGCKPNETLAGLSVHRFRYAPEKLELLAYNGGISTNLKRHPLRYLLIPFFVISELISTIRIIKKEKIDLIHAHWIIPQGLVATIASILSKNKPVILVTAHGADIFTRQDALGSSIKRFILNQCDFLTVVSHGVAEEVQKLNVKCRIDVIPMGTDLKKTFIPNNSKKNRFQLIFAGRLVEKKGVTFLIDSFKMLLDKYPELILFIIGHGPETSHLKKQVKSLAIGEKVIFTGGLQQSNLPAYFQQSSIAIFPFIQAADGDQEGFGLVLIEAMGCGCATISTDLPAVRDIIKDRNTGLLIDEKTSEGIFRAVSELMDNSELRDSLSENGRNYVVKIFDWHIISGSYIKLINRLLEEKMLP